MLFIELALGSTRSEYEIHAGSRALGSSPEPTTFPKARRQAAEDRIGDCDTRALPRVFDAQLGCYVLAKPRRDKSRLGRRRARRWKVSIPDKSGVWWWVGDRTSGVRLVKIERWCWEEAKAEALRLFPGENPFVIRAHIEC